jgi:adenosylcobinamide kinase/adenosylcobinamide-phosphate guanylyltransferase
MRWNTIVGRTILITGSPGSGKTRFAATLAAQNQGDVLCVATAELLNDELVGPGAYPHERGPLNWRTIEARRDLLGALPMEWAPSTVVIDCLSGWVANRLLDLGDPDDEDWQDQVAALENELVQEVRRLLRWARHASWRLILVTNDAGADALPSSTLARSFRELLDGLNQAVAESVDGVFAVVGGLPVELKRPFVTRA